MAQKELTPRQKQYAEEALARAQSSASIRNDLTVIEEFAARGIDEDEIIPRENVLTFWGWKAKGRYVKKGEHGVKITTFIPVTKKDEETGEVTGYKRAKTVTVFHETQTAPFGAPAAAEYDKAAERVQKRETEYADKVLAARAKFSEAAREELENPTPRADFPITLIGDPGHKQAQADTIAKLLKYAPGGA